MRAKHRLVPAVRLQDPDLLNDPNYNCRRARTALVLAAGCVALGIGLSNVEPTQLIDNNLPGANTGPENPIIAEQPQPQGE